MMLSVCRRDMSFVALGLAGLLAGCSACGEDFRDATWGTTYVQTAEAPGIAAPNCDVAGPDAQAGVDPDLVEIARLELERDCYKRAEADLRRRVLYGEALPPIK
jgi:hypothetical protein